MISGRGSIILTGARGLLGSVVAEILAAGGFEVFGVSRSAAGGDGLPMLGWDLAEGAAGKSDELPDAGYLVHCAPIWLLPRNLETLHAAGVRRVVAFSSTSAGSKASSEDPGERELARRLREGETHTADECRRLGIDWTLLRPTLIYGYGRDQNISRIAAFLGRWHFGVVAGGGRGLRQPVHATDLARAVCTVLDNDKTFGKTYDLPGGETLSYRDMMARIAEGMGQRPRVISLPVGAVRVMMRMAATTGGFNYTAEMANRMNADLAFDSTPARTDFEYSPGGFLADPARDQPAHSSRGSNN